MNRKLIHDLNCYRVKCKSETLCDNPFCHYNNSTPDSVQYCAYDNLLYDAEQLLKKQNEALRLMVFQYCTMGFGKDITFNNRCMTAGEHAFEVLGIENGQKVPDDFIDGWERI